MPSILHLQLSRHFLQTVLDATGISDIFPRVTYDPESLPILAQQVETELPEIRDNDEKGPNPRILEARTSINPQLHRHVLVAWQ